MPASLKPVSEQVVVIAGASSGIGRRAAERFAERGARVVVAGRTTEALDTLVAEITRNGGRALAVPTDVSDEAAVQALAERAVEAFGGIDTWINNAGVSVYGEFQQVPVADMRAVMEVNYWGQVYGAKAALPYLKKQGRGALLLVGSALSDRAVPVQSAYCASKHAVKALAESLRVELAHAGSEVQVTLIKPASMNTPLFDRSRTYMGVKPRPVSPVYDPDLVARALVYAAAHRTREISVGGGSKLLSTLEGFAGPLVDAWLTRTGEAGQQTNEPKPPTGPNSLESPLPGPGAVQGDFGGRGFSLYPWSRLHPRTALGIGALAAGALGGRRYVRGRRG